MVSFRTSTLTVRILLPTVCMSGFADAYVCMHRRGCGVDAFHSVTAEHCEDRVSLVHSHCLHQLPQLLLQFGSDHISPASAVPDLGIYIDSDVLIRSHVAKTVLACYSVLCQLWTIRRSVSRSVLQSLLSCLVLSRLDYGNSTLAGVSSHLLSRMQSVMNTTAGLIFPSLRFQHITPLLRQLHWLKAPERIAFKQSVLVYNLQVSTRVHTCNAYLTDELCQVADVEARQ